MLNNLGIAILSMLAQGTQKHNLIRKQAEILLVAATEENATEDSIADAAAQCGIPGFEIEKAPESKKKSGKKKSGKTKVEGESNESKITDDSNKGEDAK